MRDAPLILDGLDFFCCMNTYSKVDRAEDGTLSTKKLFGVRYVPLVESSPEQGDEAAEESSEKEQTHGYDREADDVNGGKQSPDAGSTSREVQEQASCSKDAADSSQND